MAVIHPSVFRVMKRFPEQREVIFRQFNDNESFQVLCEDYKKCSAALQFWSGLDTDESFSRKAEYEELLLGLETEILLYVEHKSLNCEEG